jgi:hypothetical protein
LSLCTTAHPLYTTFTTTFGASISEATMRPNANHTAARAQTISGDALCQMVGALVTPALCLPGGGRWARASYANAVAAGVTMGLYPIVTSQYSPTALYQVSRSHSAAGSLKWRSDSSPGDRPALAARRAGRPRPRPRPRTAQRVRIRGGASASPSPAGGGDRLGHLQAPRGHRPLCHGPGPPRGGHAPSALSTVNRFCMALLRGRAGGA